jgi:hypothetical protein
MISFSFFKRFLFQAVAVIAIAFGDFSFANATSTWTTEQKLRDLDQMVTMMKAGYGPLKYKKDNFNIDVDILRAQYAPTIAETKTNAEFYYKLLQFIAEFHDGHFRATLPTDLKASVPFDTDLVGDKVLIGEINRELLKESDFPFQKGDELVAVDGVETVEVLRQLQSYRGLGFDQSERRIAAMAITVRDGKRMPIPRGEVTFKIRRGTSTAIEEAKLTWKVEGTELDEVDMPAHLRALRRVRTPAAANYDEISTFALMNELKNPQTERTFRCSGDSRIKRPEGATVILEKPFVAYYYPTAKGNLGYLRIPHYSPEDGNYDKRFAQYEYAISELEKNTVGLVIDQDHNCGGSVEYLHRLLSLLMPTSFQPMQFQLLANKQEYLRFNEWVKESPEHSIERNNAIRVRDLIKTSWLNGDFMTPMTSISGETVRLPNAIHYTKPIVVLIDELSGSGGDAFPSMMKGFGRAKLIGTRTMGLGGHVVAQPPLFYSQITPEMTKSLFYRPDGVAVENNGAEPDFQYNITRDDFTYGYTDYRAFYENILSELL